MGKARASLSAKLIIGFIFKEAGAYLKAKSLLQKRFGRIDFESLPLNFAYTDYYRNEFGEGLTRVFVSFKRLIHLDALSRVKCSTNSLERRLSLNSKRTVNIDPGFLELSKLVLATTKDYAHRIYIGKGIFAEVTLSFVGKTFQPKEWTYPDYSSKEYITIFNTIRQIYAQQIKNCRD